MTRHIIPNSTELKLIMSGEIKKWAVPVKPQPNPSDAIRIVGTEQYVIFNGVEQVPLPHPLNQPIAVKERMYQRGFIQSDRNESVSHDEGQDYVWYPDPPVYDKPEITSYKHHVRTLSPATMPLSAVRTWLMFPECKAVRVSEVTLQDLSALTGSKFEPLIPSTKALYILHEMQRLVGKDVWEQNGFIFLFDILEIEK